MIKFRQKVAIIFAGAICVSLTMAIANDPHLDSGYEIAASKAFGAQDYNRLISLSSQTIKRDPQNSQAHFNLAVALSRLDRYNSAISEFETGWRLAPGADHVLYDQAARCYAAVSENDKALAALDKSIKIEPTVFAYRTKAELLITLNRLNEALTCLEKADKKSPNDWWTIEAMAVCYFKMGNIKEALKNRNLLVHLRPKEPRGYTDRAKLYDKLGEKELAAADRTKAAALSQAMDFMTP
jgi:tetratricopeptide (TPR) repeat protein